MTDDASSESAEDQICEGMVLLDLFQNENLEVNSDRPYTHPGEKGPTPAAMTEDHSNNCYANSNNPTEAQGNCCRDGGVCNFIDKLWTLACKKSSDPDKRYNGGKRMCLLSILFMTSIIVVIIFARLMATGTQALVTVTSQRCTIMTFCIIGLLSTFFLLMLRLPDKEGHFISTESNNVNDKVLHKWEKGMQLFCVCIFGLAGTIVPDIWTFILYVMCQSAEVNGLPIAVCYILFKIVFTILQFAVLCKYSSYRCQTLASRVGVLFLIPANIGIWLNLLATESAERIHKNLEANLTAHSPAIVSPHDPDEIYIKGDSLLADYAFIYYPLAMEFCILTTGILFEILGLTSHDGNNEQGVKKRASKKCKDRLSISCNKFRTSISICVKICSPTRICNWICTKTSKNCLCIIIFSILCLVFSVFMITILSSNFYMFETEEKTVLAYSSGYLILNISMFVASLWAWIIVYQEPSHKIVFGPSQVLLIGSTCVLGFWILFELIALSKGINSCEQAILFTADIFFISSIYFQSSLLLKNEYSSERRHILKTCLFILFILNMYMWIEDSVFSHILDIKVHKYMDEVYDSLFWSIIKLIFLPPCIFYRIHAAEMCVLKCISIHQKSLEKNESASIGNISNAN